MILALMWLFVCQHSIMPDIYPVTEISCASTQCYWATYRYLIWYLVIYRLLRFSRAGTQSFDAKYRYGMATSSACKFTGFTPAQLSCSWHEQSPSNLTSPNLTLTRRSWQSRKSTLHIEGTTSVLIFVL